MLESFLDSECLYVFYGTEDHDAAIAKALRKHDLVHGDRNIIVKPYKDYLDRMHEQQLENMKGKVHAKKTHEIGRLID